MNRDEDELSALLKRWQEIEPSATFEASVRQRIRLAAEKPERMNCAEWLHQLAWRPSLALASAVVVGVMIGSSAGVLTSRGRIAAASGELQFLGSGTLAGGYVRASARGER